MSIQYDTSGNLTFPYDSIQYIGGYKYQPILTISSFVSNSGIIFPINVRPSIYYSGGGVKPNLSISGIYTKDFFSDVKIDNFNFMNPLETNSYTYINVLPSWTVDQASGIIISRSGSPFYPISNTNLPFGYTGNYEQTLSIQTINITQINVFQQFFMIPGNYTLSFWASVRSGGYYLTSNVFRIYLGEKLIVANVSPSINNWTNYTYTYNSLFSTNVTLRIFTQNPSTADSSINFANISISRIKTMKFLSLSGNMNFQNNYIYNCQSFNGIPTSYFNQLFTISSQIYNLPNYSNAVTSLSS